MGSEHEIDKVASALNKSTNNTLEQEYKNKIVSRLLFNLSLAQLQEVERVTKHRFFNPPTYIEF